MHQIDLKFEGICTHLVATHEYGKPPFKLWTDDLIPVQHRVFLANSGLIGSHMPEGRKPVAHVPKLLIPREQTNDGLKKLFDSEEDSSQAWYPSGVAIGFEGINEKAGSSSHHYSLFALPRIRQRSKRELKLREGVERGWSAFAAAYVDFSGGVVFRTAKVGKKVVAHGVLYFDEPPVLVVRAGNVGQGRRFSLEGVNELTISNEPAASSSCDDTKDYLLHYFATDLDLHEYAPVWEMEGPAAEVYCSSSQYP